MNLNILTFNLDGIFSKCFTFKKKKKKDKTHTKEITLENFINSLKNKSQETKINLILEKLINGINDLGILYRVDENIIELNAFYGDYNKPKQNNFNILSIPIFQNSKLTYLLIIGIKTNEKIEINNDFLELLKNILV